MGVVLGSTIGVELPLNPTLHDVSSELKPVPETETNTGIPLGGEGGEAFGDTATVGPPAGEKEFDAESP